MEIEVDPPHATDSVMQDEQRPEEQQSEQKPRFEIKKWSAVAFWSWDIEIELCAICRNHIMDICIDCQAGQNAAAAENCTVSWGQCSHVFHSHCISRWLSSRPVCPLDNQPWVLQKCGS